MTISYAPLIAAAVINGVILYVHLHRVRRLKYVGQVNRWPAGKVGAL